MNQTSKDTKLILWFLVIFAVCVSFLFFQKQSLRLDESQSLWQSSHTAPKVLNLIAQDVHVPLYPEMLHGLLVFFGNGVASSRVLSLIFFLLSIPAFYLLGRRLFNEDVAIFATILFALSPFMNWYANEIRMYSLVVLIAIVNAYYFIGIFKNDDRNSWIGFAVTALLGIYSHYFFWLILMTDGIFFLIYRKQFGEKTLRRLILLAIFLLVAIAPWLVYVFSLGQITKAVPVVLSAPSTVDLFNTFSRFIIGFQTDHLNTILLSLWPITVLLGFLSLRGNRRIGPEFTFLIFAFIIPNLLAFFESIFFRPVYLTRYLIFTLPPMYLLLSFFIMRTPKAVSYALSVILIAVMSVTLTMEAFSASNPAKENYAEAASYLQANGKPTDVIVASAPFTIYPLLYYYRGPLAVKTLPLWDHNSAGIVPQDFSGEPLPAQVKDVADLHRNVWLLLSYDQGHQEDIRQYFETHFKKIDSQTFSPDLSLYEYQLRYDTDGKPQTAINSR